MAKRQLIKELEKQDKEELVRILTEMSRRFPIANMYLTMEFGFESAGIIEKYKKAIRKEYFPTRGYGKARSSKVAKILKEFTQIAAFQEDVVELMWYQIENAIDYYKLFGSEYEPFLNNLLKNWKFFLEKARKEGLMPLYSEKADALFTERFKKSWLATQLIFILENPFSSEAEEEIED
jgi:hypothetical protein